MSLRFLVLTCACQARLLGACNSYNKTVQQHFYRPVYLSYFSRQIGQFQSTRARFGKDKTMRPRVNMSTLVRAYDCNWLLRCLWGSVFELNSN